MIMILLGVAIILYIIKRINEALDPSAQEENNGKIKDDKIDAPIKIQNWSEKDFKKFQRRDLIDHYGFQFRCTLFFPKGNPRYQDKFTFNIRNDAEIQQCFVDMFKRQADCSPNGEILFEYPDILIIRKAMDRMTEDLRDMAEIRSYSGGTNVYAPFAGMHLMQTINLPALSHHIIDKKINNDEPFRRSLDIYLTLL
uniref:Uncharacterized protein n=1 Tax=Panagrolaimus sp. PS1159 TaxID=55785 RepID=A0AC35GJN0_9BILA